jgi:glycosyltransferase involved in cell wall biosynthesis
MSAPKLQIDVVIASFLRPQHLHRCLLSVMSAARESMQIRFLISSSGGNGETSALLARLQDEYPGFEMIHLHSVAPLGAAAARNRALVLAHAEWIYFIDDDAYVDPDFLEKFLELAKSSPMAAVIGGPNLTDRMSSPFQRASGAVLGSRFAASHSATRYALKRGHRRFICGEESLISCSLFVRGRALKGLSFAEHLQSNEENWLLQDLQLAGHFFLYDASLYVWHERRPNVKLFTLQVYRYGVGRGQNMRGRPLTARYFHLLPSLSLLLTSICLAISPWSPRLLELWLGLFVLYALTGMAAVLRLEFHERGSLRLRVMSGFLFPIIHVSYGLGVLRGLAAQIE